MKKRITAILVTILFTIIIVWFCAALPDYRLRGQIIDEDGKPISGVTILYNGDPISTDNDGRFEFTMRSREDVIVVMNPGSITQARAVRVIAGSNPLRMIVFNEKVK